jgi:hypothetical protein
MAITLPSDIWERYYEAADFFIDSLGEPCTVYYPPIKTECSNCVISFFNGISTNVYRHGGPAPFSFGVCPLCGGNNLAEVETTASLQLRIYWQKRDWIKVAEIIVVPDAEVQVIGYLTDLSKLRQANFIKLVTNQKQIETKYELAGEPFFWGFKKDRYFVAFLKKK